MSKQIMAVVRKEILDTRRDLKALAPGLMMPLVFALMTYGMVTFMVSLQEQPHSFQVAVEGAERAQPLMNALREAGINVVEAPEDPAAAVRAREVEMVLIIPVDLEARFRRQERVALDMIWDASRNNSHAKVYRVKQQVQRWASTTGSLRLLLRGVSPEASQVLTINDVNVASEEKMASRVLGGLPMIILLLAFVAGAGIASELAAGERENRTLEPLRITPISHGHLFAGKWLAVVLITLLLVLFGVALQLLAIASAPLEQLGLKASLGLLEYGLIMLILTPVVLLATALQLFTSFLSKSFKDAQSYNQLLMLLPVIPGIYALFGDAVLEPWMAWVPLLGPQLLVVDIFSGQLPSPSLLSVAALSSLLTASVFAVAAVHQMRSS